MDPNCQNNLLAAFRVCLLAGVASWMMPSTASAQLRSGSAPRTIYQKGVETAAGETSKTATTKPRAVQSKSDSATTPTAQPQVRDAGKGNETGLQFREPNLDGDVQSASYREGVVKRSSKSQVIKASSYQESAAQPEPIAEPTSPVQERIAYDFEPMSASSPSGCTSCDAAGQLGHVGHDSFSHSPFFASAGSMEFMPLPHGESCHPSLLGRMLSGLSVRLEATNWDRSASNMPVLVTTSPVGTDPTIAGQLGLNTTSILFGGGNVNDTPEGGGRLTLNTWLDDCRYYGLTFRGWDAGTGDTDFFASQSTHPIVARPFLDFTNGLPATQNAQLIAYPGDTAGNIRINAESEVAGGDLMLRRLLWTGPRSRWDMLYGYQFAQLNESLDIQSNSTVIDSGSLLFNTQIGVNDFFRTRNQFQGFSVGIQGAKRWGCWYFDGMFKLGLGNMERTITIAGQTRVTDSNGTTTVDNEGLLARFSNDGHYVSDTFVIVPEFGLNVGYALTNNLDITLGYTAMSLPKVAQAASQIDPQLGSNLSDPLVGEMRPNFVLTETNYWLSGFSYGLQYRY
jgi:hypothetical protein